MKRCTQCGKRKPLSAFRPHGKSRPGKLQAECKICWRARVSTQAELSRRWIREYAARWRSKNQHLIDAAGTIVELSSKRRFHLTVYHLLRHQAILAYGGYRCACCGVRDPMFLTIDHINNDGGRHRRRVGRTLEFLQWLRRKGYPPGFRVLCTNCNSGRHRNRGVCPHKDPVGKKPAFLALGRASPQQQRQARASASQKSRTYKGKWSE